MPSIKVDGARVACAESGSGATVLLLHSSASSGAQWRSLTETLRAGCRVLAPDLYGYGETDPWSGHRPLALADEAALAAAVLGPGCGPIHLVGHSYGGAVALRFALAWPGRLRSLTLIEPVAFHLLCDEAADAADRALFRQVRALAAVVSAAAARGDERGAMAQFVDYWNGNGTWSRTKPEAQAALARRAPKVALDFLATMSEPTPRAAYRQVAVPTLVLRGTRSPRPTRRIAELVAKALPVARLETIDGAGHMIPLTHPESVNAAVAAHLFRTMADRQRSAAA
jgi:pimeloyl-ACP methyl ester carboxylesterase